MRLCVAAVALIVAGLASRDAALAYWRTVPPSTVPALAVGDAKIRLTRADLAFAASGGAVDRTEVENAARAVLRSDPLNAAALASLARVTDDPVRRLALVRAAEQVSRRDWTTQLMLIEAAVQANDVPAVLTHYDRLLTVTPAASAIVQPVLAQAIAEPSIRAALVRYAPRPWFTAFMLVALEHKAAPAAVVSMLGAAKSAMAPSGLAEVAGRVSGQLYTGRRFDELRALALALPAPMRPTLANFGFGPDTSRGLPFSWSLAQAPNAQALVGTGGALEIAVGPEMRQTVAHRTSFLNPGDYLLSQRVTGIDGSPVAQLDWQVTCPGTPNSTQPVLTRNGKANSIAGEERIRLTIPSGCAVQDWTLEATGGLSQEPARASLARFALSTAASAADGR